MIVDLTNQYLGKGIADRQAHARREGDHEAERMGDAQRARAPHMYG
jgi:hypothetical protein